MHSSILNKRIFIIIIAVTAFLTFLNTTYNGFVIDDHFLIEKNPLISSFGNLLDIFTSDVHAFKTENPVTDYYRPLLFTVYTFEYLLFGLQPWGWHLFNVIFHVVNSILVFLIAWRIFGEAGDKEKSNGVFALIAGLIFAVHPISAEPVSWLACVCELSYTLFSLLALYLFMLSSGDAGQTSGKRFTLKALSVFSFLLAAFSKETALVLPGVLIAYDLARGNRPGLRMLKSHSPFWVAAIVYLALRFNALHAVAFPGNLDHSLFYYISSAAYLYSNYIFLFLFPLDLNLYHVVPVFSGFSAGLLLNFAVVIIAFILMLYAGRKRPVVAFFASIMILPILPTLYLLAKDLNIYYINIMAERYLYFPLAGFSLLAAFCLSRLSVKFNNTALVLVPVFIVIAVGAAASVKRNADWKDEFTISKATLKTDPSNFFGHYLLAEVYAAKGEHDEAIREYGESIKSKPSFSGSHHRLGLLYYSLNRLEEAEGEFREVLKVNPRNSDAYYNIALINMDRGRWTEAIVGLEKALTLGKGARILRIRNNLAVSYAKLGNLEETRRQLLLAKQQDPNDAETLNNLRYLSEQK
ncbi:MAG: tetratricopeptide repeat protein [Deltaproteobacteria bacterium]|nr:tetratricopeptide repeat protein [Deltaproteobacteria bacterium]